jgi:hypothetical protein
MERRVLLTTLLVISTAVFVIGVSVERSAGDKHTEPAPAATSGEAAEGGQEHGAEEGGGEEAHTETAPAGTEEENNETLLGVDLEAWPFVAVAAAFSLALALAVWLRPGCGLLLAGVAVTMLAFAALDVREVIHQLDESRGGLAFLAGAVAALHLGAAAVAALIGRSPAPARRDSLA